jgi:hypothetical protein
MMPLRLCSKARALEKVETSIALQPYRIFCQHALPIHITLALSVAFGGAARSRIARRMLQTKGRRHTSKSQRYPDDSGDTRDAAMPVGVSASRLAIEQRQRAPPRHDAVKNPCQIPCQNP